MVVISVVIELELNTYCCVDMRNNETILENRE